MHITYAYVCDIAAIDQYWADSTGQVLVIPWIWLTILALVRNTKSLRIFLSL